MSWRPYFLLQIVGTLVVIGSVLGGFVLEDGKLLALWHPTEILVICGSALGVFIISNPLKVVKSAFANAVTLLKAPRYRRADYVDILKLLYDILVKIRKSGMLAIEADLEAPEKSKLFSEYPRILADHHFIEFTTDSLRLMVGGAGSCRAARGQGGTQATALAPAGPARCHRQERYAAPLQGSTAARHHA